MALDQSAGGKKKNKSGRIKRKRGQNGPNQEMDCDGCASFFFCDSRLMDEGEQPPGLFCFCVRFIHLFHVSCQVHVSRFAHLFATFFCGGGGSVAMLMEGGTDASNLFGRVGIEINGRSIEPALIADSVVSGRLR